MYGGHNGFSYDDAYNKIHPAIHNIGKPTNVGLFNPGTNVPFMIFPGGAKGTMQHKAAHRKARYKANYYADTANKHFEIRDTHDEPTI